MPLMDLKVDFAFKQLFGKQGNEPILIAFLNATLKLPENERITSIEVLNSELEPKHTSVENWRRLQCRIPS